MKICFCIMPFGPIRSPNLGTSILKTLLEEIGISVKIFYFNLELAKEIGITFYHEINGENNYGISKYIGETLFSQYLFNSPIQYYKLISKISYSTNIDSSIIYKFFNTMEEIKQLIPQFLKNCLDQILDYKPDLIGFSSSYYQNCSSLLLSKIIKEKIDTPIIFGGSNCEGVMGFTLLKCFPQIDYICSGDGELAVINLIKQLLIKNKKFDKIQGILTRESTEIDINLTNPVIDMNKLPFPNFDDYFSSLKRLSLENKVDVILTMETSRGCWWGEVAHCTFCGLNGSTMNYRSKSSKKALEEITYLTQKYKIRQMHFVDNIMNPNYVKDLFPNLIEHGKDNSLFYETKSNLSKDDLTVMKKAGVHSIQPGIESFSNNILEIMRKGVTGLENIQLLKWCKEIAIIPYWNILIGFPSEPINEYDKMSKIIPLIVHLFPPIDVLKIQMSRFSPYFYDPKKYGLKNIRPLDIFKYIYPFDSNIINNIVYFFDYDYAAKQNVDEYTYHLKEQVIIWKKLWENNPPDLSMVIVDDVIIIKDTRPCAINKTHLLTECKSFIYKMCCSIKSFDKLLYLTLSQFPFLSRLDIINHINNLINYKLLLQLENKLLSLAVEITN